MRACTRYAWTSRQYHVKSFTIELYVAFFTYLSLSYIASAGSEPDISNTHLTTPTASTIRVSPACMYDTGGTCRRFRCWIACVARNTESSVRRCATYRRHAAFSIANVGWRGRATRRHKRHQHQRVRRTRGLFHGDTEVRSGWAQTCMWKKEIATDLRCLNPLNVFCMITLARVTVGSRKIDVTQVGTGT